MPPLARRLRESRAAAAAALLLVLSLQCFELRAELLFRSIEQIHGQQRWSPIKKYSNPSDIATAAGEVHVFVSGLITSEDAQSARVMESLLKSGKQKIADNSVWLASDGGDIDAAMELGRLLRKLGVFTLVGRNDRCLSACVFAFMGGERRIVAGQLGIHRPHFPYTQDVDRQARFRLLQKTLKDYMEELDFPLSLYEAVMLVPPEAMQILVAADLRRFYLEGISPSSEDLEDAAVARQLGLSMAEYLKRKAKAPACSFIVDGQGRCEGRLREVAASRNAAAEPADMLQSGAASAQRAVGRSPPEPGIPLGK